MSTKGKKTLLLFAFYTFYSLTYSSYFVHWLENETRRGYEKRKLYSTKHQYLYKNMCSHFPLEFHFLVFVFFSAWKYSACFCCISTLSGNFVLSVVNILQKSINVKKKKKTVQKSRKETKSEKKQSFDKQQTINYILKFNHLISCYVLWRYK